MLDCVWVAHRLAKRLIFGLLSPNRAKEMFREKIAVLLAVTEKNEEVAWYERALFQKVIKNYFIQN